ncbi:MAG: AAA family ATPase [Candidatus Obscuribacterales bacterium]|jgi:stage III sporulation protein AA|nr:AAA family ATPase [Candidatus Obscuribacterales bacterium]
MDQIPPADDLNALMSILPEELRRKLESESNGLIEVVIDLGRKPEARYFDKSRKSITDNLVTQKDIEYAVERVGNFSGDNRAGIERTLHRISCIRNRTGKIIGLTCRIGRAVSGTIDIIRDLVESGKSILFLGPPGVGKTTKLREITRVIADELGKRVIIIDTSNEIAGDGDVPHPAIGGARRMQVSHPDLQHAVMIEAVENHTPEVIVIDEIGTEQEAAAARTIAERGVQLIGTAHGNALENLLKNPTLVDLIGGIQTVTLGDDEARRRGTQKTVLERATQPTFEICVEIIDRQTLAIHKAVAESVDQLLRGWKIHPEIRRRDESTGSFAVLRPETKVISNVNAPSSEPAEQGAEWAEQPYDKETYLKIYPYAVSKGLLERVVKTLNLPAEVVKTLDEADAILALRSYARAGAKIYSLAEAKQIPVYVVKSNNMPQIQKALREALHLDTEIFSLGDGGADIVDETEIALEEARQAITMVMNRLEPMELAPRKAYIRRLQHQLVERFNLTSRSVGDEPMRRLRILPPPNTQSNVQYM